MIEIAAYFKLTALEVQRKGSSPKVLRSLSLGPPHAGALHDQTLSFAVGLGLHLH